MFIASGKDKSHPGPFEVDALARVAIPHSDGARRFVADLAVSDLDPAMLKGNGL
jgi:hypothetical protein